MKKYKPLPDNFKLYGCNLDKYFHPIIKPAKKCLAERIAELGKYGYFLKETKEPGIAKITSRKSEYVGHPNIEINPPKHKKVTMYFIGHPDYDC
jgi:hypothetical protein